MSRTTTIAITSALGGLLLGACIFKKADGGPSPVQLLQLLAQATSCWITAGSSVSTSCNVTVTGRISSSTLGVYCGKTSGTFTGNMGGYAAAKGHCETACGSPAAHMCSAHELLMTMQLGITGVSTSDMWYATGIRFDVASVASDDCNNPGTTGGWTSADASYRGAVWRGGKYSVAGACNSSLAIACCL